MRYLSLDLEATGLKENDYIIEFGAVPFDTETQKVEDELSLHFYVHCPPLEVLESRLDEWVLEHNSDLIRKATNQGLSLSDFKAEMSRYLNSSDIKNYFNFPENKIVIFGKSLNAIDLPFLTRDLSWNFMRDHFHHQVLDLSSVARNLVDLNILPEEASKGSELMKLLGLGEVEHTALEDARNTAIMYLEILKKFSKDSD